jgi:predicted O-methyltransferase YrrM
MNHFYQKIQGWFIFQTLYESIVKKYDNAIFVEVGSWLGRSSVYMAVEIINNKKNIKFYTVDTWEGDELLKKKYNSLIKENKLFRQFLLNIEPVKNNITPLKMSSVQASKLFDNNSIDFCFIDADHSYESIKQDLRYWYPKIKKNKLFAGCLDYRRDGGVLKAVTEFAKYYNTKFIILESIKCWVLIKK